MLKLEFNYDGELNMLEGKITVDDKCYVLRELEDEELPFDGYDEDEDFDEDDEEDEDDDGFEECEDDDDEDEEEDKDDNCGPEFCDICPYRDECDDNLEYADDDDDDEEFVIEAYDMSEGGKKIYDSREDKLPKNHKHLEDVIRFIEKHLSK